MTEYKKKKKRTFGKLPVSVAAKNTEWWLNEGWPRMRDEVLRRRAEMGQEPDSTKGVW